MGIQRNYDCQSAGKNRSKISGTVRWPIRTLPHHNQAGYRHVWIYSQDTASSLELMLFLERIKWTFPTSSQFFIFWPHQSWLKMLRTLTKPSRLKVSWHTSVTNIVTPPPRSFWILHHSWTQGSKRSTSAQATSLLLRLDWRLKWYSQPGVHITRLTIIIFFSIIIPLFMLLYQSEFPTVGQWKAFLIWSLNTHTHTYILQLQN